MDNQQVANGRGRVANLIAHGVWFFIVAVSGVVCIKTWPDLVKDLTTSFSTIGFFVTLYGVIFAIVEVKRAKSAAELAEKAAKQAHERINDFFNVRNIVECQKEIETAVSCIDNGHIIPTTTLCNIVKHYSQIFYVEMEDDNSKHRKNQSYIESYRFSASATSTVSNSHLKKALLSSMRHLSQMVGSKSSYKE